MRRLPLFLFTLCLAFSACTPPVHPGTGCETRAQVKYLFMGHILEEDTIDPRIDDRLEFVNLEIYDVLMLGGDLASRTTETTATLDALDAKLHLGRPNTLWTLGNHDYTFTNRVTQYTGRDLFYTWHHNGITFLILDTMADSAGTTGGQLDLLTQITDTLAHSTHLVVLHHKFIWIPGHPDLEPGLNNISNVPVCPAAWCLSYNNYYDEVYPRLVQTQERGIQVICLTGDMGKRSKTHYFKSPEGIEYISAGFGKGGAPDQVILFHHAPGNCLEWEFVNLDYLVDF